MTEIAVVVPVHNRKDVTLNYLRQLPDITAEGVTLTAIIVDDGSTDGTEEAIRRQFPQTVVLKGDGNLWWTGAIKMGVEYALAHAFESILIMNDDLELDHRFLAELLKVADQYPDALVSSIKLNKTKDGREQIIAAGFKIAGFLQEIEIVKPDEIYNENMPEILECDILTGSSLLIPAKVFHAIGMFDNAKYPHGFGDFEFTLRASQAGFKCLVATRSRIYTEYNQNYPNRYLIWSTRKDFLRNLFSKTKFSYGFFALYQICFMRKPFIIGVIHYCRRLLGLFKKILMKMLLPNKLLRILVNENHLNEA